jgi:uncharacterized protein RhaS with RHS repeats
VIALGQRRLVKRSASTGDVKKFVYDGQDVIRDLDASGSVIAEYLNGPGFDNKIRQWTASNGSHYFTQDHLGSTRALTDSSGNIAATWNYDSFGNVTSASNSSLTR